MQLGDVLFIWSVSEVVPIITPNINNHTGLLRDLYQYIYYNIYSKQYFVANPNIARLCSETVLLRFPDQEYSPLQVAYLLVCCWYIICVVILNSEYSNYTYMNYMKYVRAC